MDFGFNGSASQVPVKESSTAVDSAELISPVDEGSQLNSFGDPLTKIEDAKDKPVNDGSDASTKSDNKGDEKPSDDKDGDSNDKKLEAGYTVEVGKDTYTVDDNGNLVDKDGKIFKEAKDVNDWIEQFDVDNNDTKDVSIDTIQETIGIEITDDNDKPIQFENTPEGIAAYINAVIETSREEHMEAAINTLYQKYPIIEDVLNYYVANGNSLDGFGEIPDRSNITIDDTNEAQQENIIRLAWSEQGRKGDVNAYVQYLKSSGTLLAVAQEELQGLQESDKQYREQIEQEAIKQEQERLKNLETYWNGVKEVVDSRKIAGYTIPDTIIVNRDGQKLSVTPNDFFNYLYRVDNEGKSQYERDLAKEDPNSRRDDEILRAYLKFVGGSYSNLVDMAVNDKEVNKLKLVAKERRASSIKVRKPAASAKKADEIDLGFN